MLGAAGVSARVQRTADGEIVLSDAGALGRWPRRRRISETSLADLPGLVRLADVLAITDAETVIGLTVTDVTEAEGAVEVMRTAGDLGRLWLSHDDHRELAGWRERWPEVVLVHRGRIGALDGGPERHASRLAEAGVGGLSMPAADWTGGLTTLVHRFDLDAVATDARVERVFVDLVRMGIDAVHSGHVELLVDVVARDGAPGDVA